MKLEAENFRLRKKIADFKAVYFFFPEKTVITACAIQVDIAGSRVKAITRVMKFVL